MLRRGMLSLVLLEACQGRVKAHMDYCKHAAHVYELVQVYRFGLNIKIRTPITICITFSIKLVTKYLQIVLNFESHLIFKEFELIFVAFAHM